MKVFPFFENIEGKTFLIVGGGRIAAEKVMRLIPFADKMHVVGTWVSKEIRQMADGRPQIYVEERPFAEEDLEGADYCIAATDVYETNRKIHDLCVQHKIPVNVVDTMELCEFIFPSLIKRGDLTVAISTAGKSPAMARYVKKQVESVLPEETEGMLERLGALRQVLPSRISEQKKRGRAYKEIMELLLETDNTASDEAVYAVIEKYQDK
ncbi:MAG: bifunctional precorrin-2 dehydrogenase/sirohydrochlorin ferrochelatase [Eubacterium sp.]|nr:bifunctional precorrin-2 dehydrogenase/sirohydrochlorin ferrochelatase [Eubacterium sp.]